MFTPASVAMATLMSTVSYLAEMRTMASVPHAKENLYCRIDLSIQMLFVSGRFLHASAAALTMKSFIVIPCDFTLASFDFGVSRSLSF